MRNTKKKRLEQLEKQSDEQSDEIEVKIIWMDEDNNIQERTEKRKREDAPPDGSITVDWS